MRTQMGVGGIAKPMHTTPLGSRGAWFRFASYRLDSDELGRLPIHEGFLLRMAIDVEIAHHASNGGTDMHVHNRARRGFSHGATY